MTRVLKFRRGTTAEHAVFAGAEGEVTVNTDKDCLIVHDALTVGGIEHVNLNSAQRLTNKDIVATELNVTGFSTFTSVEVGSGVTITSNDIDVTGIITATSFVGDGSNLTNTGSTLSASSGSQRIVLTSQTSGTMTASSTNSDLTYDTTTNTLIVSNISIGGTLTYEDVTNIDSIGIITARSDVKVGRDLSVVGISTLGNTIVGSATTELIVNGDARITGILTIGTGTITINGDTNEIGVGTVTLSESKISQLNDLTGSDGNFGGNVSVGQSVTATTFYGDGTIPLGGIIMWSGTIANIPLGWALCNGSNGTPDLRNRFIVAAGTDTNNIWSFNTTSGAETFTSGQSYVGINSTGGSVAHKMTVAEMPSHTHSYTRTSAPSGGQDQAGSGSGDAVNQSTVNTGSAGSNNYHENRPPYYALAFIMRTS